MTTELAEVATGGAVASYDEEMIKRIQGATGEEDAQLASGPETLKINYDEDSVHPRGVWVFGQRKNADGIIDEEGELVDKIIVLTTANRYAYYDQDEKKFYDTQIFKNGEQPRDMAEVKAAVAAVGGELKFQTVILGLAIIGKEMKEFIAYVGGSSYKPFRDHMKDLTTFVKPDGTKISPWPTFMHLTILGETEKKKNGSITYWVPSFQKGAEIPIHHLDALEAKRQAAKDYIVFHNQRKEAANNGESEESAPAASAPAASAPSTAGGSEAYSPPAHTVGDDVPMTTPPTETKPEAELVSTGGEEEDYDIEAAMQSIIGS